MLPAQQPRVADDRVQRRAQLVRQHGEEFVLHPVGGLGLGVQPGVLQRHGCPRGHAQRETFVLLGEHADLGMTEEQPAENIPGDTLDRYRKVAADRQVSWRHTVIGRALSVAGILRHIVQPHWTLAMERRSEDGRRARMGKLREGLARSS